MNFRPVKVAWISLVFGTVGGAPVFAQEPAAPSEYQVKAAFLYNFAKFIEWPARVFPATNSPITIGILGGNPFDGDLKRTVQNKVANGHPVLVQSLSSANDPALKRCQIVFIQPADKTRLEEDLEALKSLPILSVSETEGFTRSGGMINFVMEGKKVRFEINDPAATAAGLKISSKLLNLAKRPEPKAEAKR